jgi:hypothetical protein
MTEKNIKSRVIHKHDIEAHWLLAENFIPKQGEIIVYDIDENYAYERFKIGDGETLVSALPFVDENIRVGKISTISLPASGWITATNVYSQVVSVAGATANSKVDIYPTPEQLIDLQLSGISLVAVNEDGVVTVYALNNKPTSDYSMQVTITEINKGA